MNAKRLIAATLIFLILVGAGSPAQAREPFGQSKIRIIIEFSDLEEALWALKYIEKMKLDGIIKGMGDGTFRPNSILEQAQAIAMTARFLDLESAAQARSGDELDFPGAGSTPDWARGYLAIALEKGWVSANDLHPNKPASRLWVTALLVRSLGLESLAKAKAGTALTFKDAGQIPADMVGHVAVAVEKKLLKGFDDGTYRPDQPVTRAQMAALMERSDTQAQPLRPEKKKDEVEGILVKVEAGAETTLHIKKEKGETVLVKVYDNPSVYLNDRLATIDDLRPGDEVEVKLREGVVVYIEAEVEEAEVEGIVTAITDKGLTVKDEDGEEFTWPVAAGAEITIEDRKAELTDLQVGDAVEATIIRGEIVEIEAEREDFEAEGRVVKIVLPKEGTPGLLTIKDKSGQEYTFKVSFQIKAISDVSVGDLVEVEGEGDLVLELEIEEKKGS